MANLPKELFEHDFISLSKRETHPRTRLRFLVLSHIKEGIGIEKAAKLFRICRTTIYDWLQRLESEGIEGLKEKKGRGAKQKLPPDQHEAFKKAVLELQHNRTGGRIRGEDILRLMQEKFSVTCSIDTVYRTLSRVNLVWITGRSIHPKADLEAQENFKKNLKKF